VLGQRGRGLVRVASQACRARRDPPHGERGARTVRRRRGSPTASVSRRQAVIVDDGGALQNAPATLQDEPQGARGGKNPKRG